MKPLLKKLPYSKDCPDESKCEPNDHQDCEFCDWEGSCESCGGQNDGDDTRCCECELERSIRLADRMCDEAEGK